MLSAVYSFTIIEVNERMSTFGSSEITKMGLVEESYDQKSTKAPSEMADEKFPSLLQWKKKRKSKIQ